MPYLGSIGVIDTNYSMPLTVTTLVELKLDQNTSTIIFNHNWQPLSGFGDNLGTITGIIFRNGKVVSRPVILMQRSTRAKITEVMSDIHGNFTFTNVDKRLDYFLVSVDSDASIKYNATVLDRVAPT